MLTSTSPLRLSSSPTEATRTIQKEHCAKVILWKPPLSVANNCRQVAEASCIPINLLTGILYSMCCFVYHVLYSTQAAHSDAAREFI